MRRLLSLVRYALPASFGARLRQRREEQQIALSTIAGQTKIKLSLLEALERDDVSRWPSGIFRRAYIRAYAHAIGLAPDGVVREFLEVYPEPADESPLNAETAPKTNPLRNLVSSAIAHVSGRPSAIPETPRSRIADPSGGVATSEKPVEKPSEIPSAEIPLEKPQAAEPSLSAAAQLCTRICQVEKTSDLLPLLHEASEILDAIGLIVWLWSPDANELMPILADGYSDAVIAQLPGVKRDSDNATAAAFRTAQVCTVNGSDRANGALVAPLTRRSGCAGVLAVELPDGNERNPSVVALVTIFAAQLAMLIEVAPPSQANERKLA